MKFKEALPIAAIGAVLIYLVFSSIALLHFPTAYSPFSNWLSDLGNPIKNPSGAIFYELAGVLTSIALFPFFVLLYRWNTGERKIRILLSIAQVSGILFAVSFIMTALFPLGVNDSIHSLFSIMLFVFIGFFELFSASAIRRIPNRVKWVPYLGFSIAAVNFMLGVSFNFANFYFGEWIMIGMFIAYTLTLATLQDYRIKSELVKNAD
jgi:hypothetical protein